MQAVRYFLLISIFVSLSLSISTYFDNFQEGYPSNKVSVTLNSQISSPISRYNCYKSSSGASDTELLGGERDLQETVTEGKAGQSFITEITRSGATGWLQTTLDNSTTVLLQYDGVDGSMNLNTTGLTSVNPNGVDFTSGGTNALYIDSFCQYATPIKISIYDVNGGVCTYSGDLPYFQDGDLNVPFSTFSGSCSFTQVGAMEVSIQLTASNSYINLYVINVVKNIKPPSL